MVKQFLLSGEERDTLLRLIPTLSKTEKGLESINIMIEKEIITEKEIYKS